MSVGPRVRRSSEPWPSQVGARRPFWRSRARRACPSAT
jgi:hypothetical protein